MVQAAQRPPTGSPAATLVAGMVDLVPLPQAYIRIREAVDDPMTDLRAVAEIVSSDPALTARVLRLVNSAYIGLMTPIDSIDHAVRVLGMQQIHDMALATSAVGSLSRLRGELLNIFDFWRLSVYCAGTAREIAARVCLPTPQRLFVCGLLHNVGNLVIAHEMPDGFTECQRRACETQRPYYDLQRELFGFDYAEVAAELMGQWHLPEQLLTPIQQHTQAIGSLPEQDQPFAAVLSIAATTARAANWQSDASEPVPEYDDVALGLTGVDAEGIESLMACVDDAVTESLVALIPGY